MTIKEIMNNEELLENIAEDLEDFDENTEVVYEVWALGYDENDEVTDAEICLFNSTNPEEAVDYAKKVELTDIAIDAENGLCSNDEVVKIYIEVESTVCIDDDFMNIGTIYKRELLNKADEEFEEADDCVVIALSPEDYEILPDNTLKVNCFALKGYNKNDSVMVCLLGTDLETFPLQYIIKSRVMYEDGDYYHCELEY